MPGTCPHCGVRLPAVVDAFCPDCRTELGPPAEATGPPPPNQTGAADPDTSHLGALAVAVVAVAMYWVPLWLAAGLVVCFIVWAAAERRTSVTGRGKTRPRQGEQP